MTSVRLGLCITGSLLALAPATAFADPIIISETSGGTVNTSPAIYSEQIGAASWTTTSAYSNVSIAATVGAYVGSGTMTAYLTTAIGPTETAADQVATSTIPVGGGPEQDTFFSGLSLGAGTYYLVLTSSATPLDYWFGSNGAGGTTITTDTGVTYGGDYFVVLFLNGANPPASNFTYVGDNGVNFQVTGDSASTVPEPGSISLVLIGMAGGLYLFRRRLTA
jgi:hypothetical protein